MGDSLTPTAQRLSSTVNVREPNVADWPESEGIMMYWLGFTLGAALLALVLGLIVIIGIWLWYYWRL